MTQTHATRPPRHEARGHVPAELRRDVRQLADALGRILREEEGSELLDDVERLRAAAIAGREAGAWDEVERIVASFDLERARQVARAFTLYFRLANLAEQQHRVRVLRRRGREHEFVPDSLAAAVEAVRTWEGDGYLQDLTRRLEVTPVLTAHPTEARRRAVQDALARLAEQIDRLDDPRLPQNAAADAERRILEEIAILWDTDPLRPHHPSPLDEVRGVMGIFDRTLFRLVPALYRELDRVLGPHDVGIRPSRTGAFLRFGSWIGGDRDGNPRVTAEVTRAAVDVHADHTLRGFEQSVRQVGRALSVSEEDVVPSDELRSSLAADEARFPRVAERQRARTPEQPHRRKLLLVAERLAATRTEAPGAYADPAEFIEDVRVVQRSLEQAGSMRLAYGRLQHLVWQVEAFGFHLVSLEVRQHSDVHEAALHELAPRGGKDAAVLDRIATEGLAQDAGVHVSDTTREVLATFRAMRDVQARYGSDACHRYVVSFTRTAADVAGVYALGRIAVPDGSLVLDVVPLFESRADLERAPSTLDELCELPGFAGWLDGRARRMEVMLGYSDSAKDAGFLAGNVALHTAQGELAAWARQKDVKLTLFHGRGGALGRGGGPTNWAIRGQAAGSVDGRFKVTEQGEVIFDRYARAAIAARHLEQIAGAVLVASTPTGERIAAEGTERYGAMAQRIARAGERTYRELVTQPGFAEFFDRVTPINEIEQMRIGSRPARRGEGRELEGLRAIPWVFAWSQIRCNLAGWYGVGSGLAAGAEEPGGLVTLRRMGREWSFFAAILGSVELSLARADLAIARRYFELGERPDLAKRIEDEFHRTVEMLLAVTEQEQLFQHRPLIGHSAHLRDPYVDALSFLQLRALTGLRREETTEQERAQLERLAMLTIDGIAAGLQTTG